MLIKVLKTVGFTLLLTIGNMVYQGSAKQEAFEALSSVLPPIINTLLNIVCLAALVLVYISFWLPQSNKQQ